MKKRFVNFLAIFGILFISIGAATKMSETEEAHFEKTVSRFFKAYSKEMKKKYGLHAWGTGGEMAHGIDTFDVSLSHHPITSIDEAREIEIIAVNELVDMVNENETIRPFLNEYPFPARRARITISFEGKNHTYAKDEPSLVINAKNRLFYKTLNNEKNSYSLLHEEPYEAAYKIVMGNR